MLAEDDLNLGRLLKEYLEVKSYEVVLANDGSEALESFNNNSFDLLLLDVMMPFKDGFTLAREIRARNSQVPLIFLTARSGKDDAIKGFKAGADDYVQKPFSMEELLLRIQAVLKRSTGQANTEQEEYSIGDYYFNFPRQLLRIEEKEIKLTGKEAHLLKILCQNRNNVTGRTEILKQVWGDDSYFNGRSMDVYIAKLRKYLKKDPSLEIMNIHGKGFRLVG